MIVFVGYTATADVLSIERPKDTLFSVTNIFQIIFMFVIQAAGQALSIVIYKLILPDYYAQFGGKDNNQQYYDTTGNFTLEGV